MSEGLAKYVEPNLRMHVTATPNDIEWRENWGLDKIGAPFAWNETTGSRSVVIAIIDTGVDLDHPDLSDNIWINVDEDLDGEDNDGNGFVDDICGWDFVDTYEDVWPGEDGTERDNDPMDFHGHGTHCAGIAAAVGNNTLGVCGVTWNCRIMAVRAGYKGDDEGGHLELDDAAGAIVYAVDNGAQIISCSWGTHYPSQMIHEAVRYAYEAGVLVVAAAGNENSDMKLYPAGWDEVMAVSATNKYDDRPFFPNFGNWIEIAAPGELIYSTVFNDSYAFMDGTSMSTPFVAGVAALVWSRFPDWNRDQIRGRLLFTSHDLGELGFDPYFGHGRLDARNAVTWPQEAHDLAVFGMYSDPTIPEGQPFRIDASLINMGSSDEQNVIVQFIVNNSIIKSKVVNQLMSGQLQPISFLWDTSGFDEGYYNLTLYAVPDEHENRTEDNSLSKQFFVRSPRILRVPQDFVTIQDAVDEALEGDIVKVASGRYHEQVFIYRNYVKLIGEDTSTTIVSGELEPGDVIAVWGADHVEICNFTVTRSSRSPTREQPFSGILVFLSQNVNIVNVSAISNKAGIFLYASHNVTLKGNRMLGNKFDFGVDGIELQNFIHKIDDSNIVGEKRLYYLKNRRNNIVPSSAGCVVLFNCSNIEAENLDLTHNYFGLCSVSSDNVTISNLTSSLNHIGVHVRDCVSVTVRSNNITENYVGVKIQESSQCKVESNILSGNDISLWLSSSYDNLAVSNEISRASLKGTSLTNAHSNILTQNEFTNNTYQKCVALHLESSGSNRIYHNSFINNRENVFSVNSESIFDNGYPNGGNYWKDYNGTDIYSGPCQNENGSDLVGDAPFTVIESIQDRYPIMSPYPCIHAVATGEVRLYKTVVGEGLATKIQVEVANMGHFTENFTVTVYANASRISEQSMSLSSRTSESLIFIWNTTDFLKGNYTIEAATSVIIGEAYTSDNNFTDGWTIISIVGDITGPEGYPDGRCEMRDVGLVARHFGCSIGNICYEPNCDLTGPTPGVPDGFNGMRDIGLVAKQIGKTLE
ncbi:MAG: S8 family serine peptidase [Nitrososphaeria archaeon]|nr:S8 family serine peptidase [Nitrososphaeria archaeon]